MASDHEKRMSLIQTFQEDGALNLHVYKAREDLKDTPFAIAICHTSTTPGKEMVKGIATSKGFSLNAQRMAKAALSRSNSMFAAYFPLELFQPMLDEDEDLAGPVECSKSSKYGVALLVFGFGGVSSMSVFIPPDPRISKLENVFDLIEEFGKYSKANKIESHVLGVSPWGSFEEMEKDLHKKIWNNPGNN